MVLILLIRAVYLISRSGLLLVDRVYGNVENAPDPIMVSSFFSALLTFSNESVKQLANALDPSGAGIAGGQIDAFTYGSFRFLFYEQSHIFAVLVVSRAADLEMVRPLGEKILEKFLNTYGVHHGSSPDMSIYEPFRPEMDRILVQDIDLAPVRTEIEFFKNLLQVP
ncbi:MAG TPA: hypothetical protein VJ044_00495 [Candidatus Hodarchaeales archaeon]|nr:hypothetical protein [Candidatus Hodarchaeales archaeon]